MPRIDYIKPGRGQQPVGEKATPLNVTVGISLRAEIDKLSRKDQVSVSSLVRNLLREALDARAKGGE